MGFDHLTQDAHSPRTRFGTLRFACSIGIGKVRFAAAETWNPKDYEGYQRSPDQGLVLWLMRIFDRLLNLC